MVKIYIAVGPRVYTIRSLMQTRSECDAEIYCHQKRLRLKAEPPQPLSLRAAHRDLFRPLLLLRVSNLTPD